MKLVTKSVCSALALTAYAAFSLPALAGPGESCHFHGDKPAEPITVSRCADLRKETLLKAGKIEKSWSVVKPGSVTLVDGKKGKEWKVVFANPASTDKSKTSLYMFFSPAGNFIAANHTGN